MSGPGGKAGLIEFFWVAMFAVGGLFLGWFTSEELCGSTDGSFDLNDPQAVPSDYCEAAHLPGFPDSVESWLLVGGLYLGPALLALAGVVLATRTRRLNFRTWGFGLAAVLLVAVALFSVSAAEVDYVGRV